ncbi:unnamed protein product [Adineta steineri]|uniref:NAD(P)(+)--arginine ADP-ribosyltransferase n=1 Tax=Adineta steineri TaxID=433720 RepID=A0A815N2L8_9BILA|nr:unnamed protein product [Adineta steineri]CAF1624419.1 unnamed protein product [Adineta steineri]
MDVSDQIWLEDLILIWLDSHIHSGTHNDEIIHKLRTCINYIKMYNDPDQCINYITCFAPTAQRIILIVSPSIGEIIIPLINNLPQLISIYVFCNTDQPKFIDLQTKIFSSIDQLVHQLSRDAKKFLEQSITSTIIYADEKTFRNLSRKTDNVMFMWWKYLIEILLKIPQKKYNPRQDILNELRLQYNNDSIYEHEINKFETTYQSNDAIKWYTSDCFLYRILNQAFRTENIDLIYRYRFFFSDLYKNIQELHLEQQETLLKDVDIVYRGQCINSDEFNKLCTNIGSLVVMNNFLSTSLTKELAYIYSGDGEQKPDKESIIYEIHIDNQYRLSQPFANIRDFSVFPDEDEILFVTGTVFQLQSIYSEGNRWIVKLFLTDGKLPDTDDVNQYHNIHSKKNTTLTAFGFALLKAGQYESAEKYFQLQLLYSNAPPVRVNSGRTVEEHELSQSIRYLLNSGNETSDSLYDNPCERVYLSGSPTQHELLSRFSKQKELEYTGLTYNNLGLVNHYMENFDKALSYYNQALEFYFRSAKLLHNHPLIADSNLTENMLPYILLSRTHGNIGLTYLNIHAYALADRNFKMDLKWYEKAACSYMKDDVPDDELARIYHNMGDLYATTFKYDLALEYFNRTLAILTNAHVPNSHPMIATTYHNLANIYFAKKDRDSALSAINKAYDLCLNMLPSTHPDFRSTLFCSEGIQAWAKSNPSSNDDIREELVSKILENINTDSTEHYYARGIHFFQQEDYHIALENLLQCVELGSDTTALYILIARIYEKQEKRSESISFYEKAIKSTSDDDYLNECYLSIVHLYTLEKNYQNALRLNEERVQIMMNQSDHLELAFIYKTNANLHRYMNDSKNELLNWEKAIEHALESDNNILLVEIYLGVGDAHYHNNCFDLAEKYYQQAKSTLENSSILSPKNLYSAYNKLGILHEHGTNNYELALNYYENALIIAVIDLKSTTNEIIANAYYNLALLHYKILNYLSAIDYCQTAIDSLLSALDKNNNTHNLLQNIYYTLAQVYLDDNNGYDAHETFHKLWLTGIYSDHPAYPFLRSQFYNENDTVSWINTA